MAGAGPVPEILGLLSCQIAVLLALLLAASALHKALRYAARRGVPKLSSTGLVNTREHLESLFVATESGVANIQRFLRSGYPRRASSGE
jgi:hypothetical protein